MNKLLFLFFFNSVLTVRSQTTEVVVSENFDNNRSGWISDGQIFNLANGVIRLESSSNKDFFNFASTSNGIVAERAFYSIMANIKIESLSEGARSGIAVADVIDETTSKMLSGYIFYVELYNGQYFLTCHNIDDKTPKEVIGFDLFTIGEYIELKVIVDNTIGSCKVYINDDMAYNLEGPMFNITQIGLYGKGILDCEYSDLTVEQSLSQNTKFAYDIIDNHYDETLKLNRIYRGRYDFEILLSYVPKILLCDNLYFMLARESNFTFDDLLNNLMNDLDCIIVKSSYTDDNNPNLKYYKLIYRNVSLVIAFNKDSNYVVSSSIIFKTTKDADSFFNEYIRLKKFKKEITEDGVKFASHPLMVFSFITQDQNMVNFLY
jgi:hypothetical protein